ncbi:phosphoribosylamine--glycine ligase [Marinigracilibium pacificum]|uniref:Phosphoribosylamine--glycine ligase n=1 Tax=Marinigracilibium pacificum TaxID=2729599 RepID=A0A848IWZ5_9BACT|nr:phosphoribosylamine--glycine ligase [Marinigracilibium pacificum]NMM48837.1 phosphoribosylamine--glycine ligase [Marinigracilibium pacificum]
MNILVIGSGGREHTLSWKISESKHCDNLFIAPGNAGTENLGKNVELDISDHTKVADFINDNNIKMVVIGPEAPLVDGLSDSLKADSRLGKLIIIGPQKAGAELEGSKDFSKQFMVRHGIPTAKSETFTKETLEKGYAYLESLTAPYVLKADGLAAGKGVVIAQDINEAKTALKEMLVDAKFGDASSQVVIEEFLSGIELSVFVLTNGKQYIVLPEAKDYKRIGEGDTGLNTGGMGAISPVPFAQGEFLQKVEEKVIKPTISGLEKDNIPYQGFIFIGLMNVNGEPFVIEYNVRMGDPETEAVIPRIKSDLVEAFIATDNHTLNDYKLEVDEETTTTVILVSGGYPESYEKGKAITGLDLDHEATIFHAGTKVDNGNIVTSGGRVLALTGKGKSMQEALKKAYSTAEKISWDKIYFRKDIGFDL